MRKPAFSLRSIWKILVVIAVIAVAWAIVGGAIDMRAVHEKAARTNGVVVFALLVLLPLIGFPVAVLHFAVGIRFGLWIGLGLVAVSIPLQLAGYYGLVRWQKEFFRDKFKGLRGKIPPGAHDAMAVFTLLIPGAPYFAQNYALALMGVPFRVALRWAMPLNLARAAVTILVGDQSDHLTRGRIAWIALYALVLVGASWLAYRRLHARMTGRRRAGNGRKSPA